MKTLQSLPTDKGFFDIYAKLIKTLIAAGILAQLVSGLTEIGGINTATLQALEPLHLGAWAVTLSAAVALLATLTIEIGLRQTFPKAVDSILYGRWHGLHLPMSIFVWLLSVVLIITSAVLSFKNSRVIVDRFTPETEQITTEAADSMRAATLQAITTTYQADSTLTATNYAGRTETTVQAFESRLKATQATIEVLQAKERRTGNSYATRKDKARQKLADIEAEKAAELAKLQRGLSHKLQALNAVRRAGEAKAGEVYAANIEEIKAANLKAETDRETTVNSYGGGLGWFTIICQFLFVVSVILDRIQRKGAGIEESVQIESYDFRPGWIVEGWGAISERWNHWIHSKIKAFADATPAAPKPAEPGAVYDIAKAMQQVTFKLELSTATEEAERVIYLNAKEPEKEDPPRERKQIGFNREGTENSTATHENSCAVKDAPTVTNLADAKQRLKQYKRRLGSHQQKALKQEREKGKVCKRTADAVANNAAWVSHWENVIHELQNS